MLTLFYQITMSKTYKLNRKAIVAVPRHLMLLIAKEILDFSNINTKMVDAAHKVILKAG